MILRIKNQASPQDAATLVVFFYPRNKQPVSASPNGSFAVAAFDRFDHRIAQMITLFRQRRTNPICQFAQILERVGHVTEDARRAAVRVVGAEDDAPDSMHEDRAHAHEARLQRGVERHLGTPVPDAGDLDAFDCLDLGMTVGSIRGRPDGVLTLSDNLAVEDDHRADGQVPIGLGVFCQFDGVAEKRYVCVCDHECIPAICMPLNLVKPDNCPFYDFFCFSTFSVLSAEERNK